MKYLSSKLLKKIEKNPSKFVDWDVISANYILSEEFIEKYSDKVDWFSVSEKQKLSEKFIEKYSDKVDWFYISEKQKLSEEFIEKYADQLNWGHISKHQKLSETFIEKHSDKVNWICISAFQKLSEEFIEKHSDKVDWNYISQFQKLSPKFIKKHNLYIPGICWLYKDKEFKRKYIQENTQYKIIGDKVIAYKTCRDDGYSVYNFQFKYEVGGEYKAHADFRVNDGASFGLSAWTKKGALQYHPNGKLFKVEIDLDDIAAIVNNNNKIRATRIKILEEIPQSKCKKLYSWITNLFL